LLLYSFNTWVTVGESWLPPLWFFWSFGFWSEVEIIIVVVIFWWDLVETWYEANVVTERIFDPVLFVESSEIINEFFDYVSAFCTYVSVQECFNLIISFGLIHRVISLQPFQYSKRLLQMILRRVITIIWWNILLKRDGIQNSLVSKVHIFT